MQYEENEKKKTKNSFLSFFPLSLLSFFKTVAERILNAICSVSVSSSSPGFCLVAFQRSFLFAGGGGGQGKLHWGPRPISSFSSFLLLFPQSEILRFFLPFSAPRGGEEGKDELSAMKGTRKGEKEKGAVYPFQPFVPRDKFPLFFLLSWGTFCNAKR